MLKMVYNTLSRTLKPYSLPVVDAFKLEALTILVSQCLVAVAQLVLSLMIAVIRLVIRVCKNFGASV